MDASRKIDHLDKHLVSLNPVRMRGIDSITKMKVEAARIRHAELLVILRGMESEAEMAENDHLKQYMEAQIDAIRPQVKYAFDTIRPYTYI